jgi:membrane-associated protein
MTDWLLALVPQYGFWLLMVGTFCSCLALPVPVSVLMLAAGGFVSAGDLSLVPTASAALAGAVAGDQVGYFAARRGGAGLIAKLGSRAAPLAKATAMLAARGGIAIFLTRWLFSALGPYVNLAAGAARQPWGQFTAWGVVGEVVWVGLYISLGYAFTGNLEAASAMALEMLGFLAASAVAMGLGLWLFVTLRAERPAQKS